MTFTLIFSSTGIAFSLLFLALAFLTYRFFQYWQRSKDITSKFFLYLAISLTLFISVRAISGLFFANDLKALLVSTFFVTFFEGLSAAIVAYLIIYLKFPHLSPKVGFWIIFLLGLLTTALNIILKPATPFIEPYGAISYRSSVTSASIFYYILRLGILLITFIPLIIILFKQAKEADRHYIKYRAIGLILALFSGAISGFIDFFLVKFLHFSATTRDIFLGITSIFLFIVIFLTQKSPTLKNNGKNF